jgi:uncharacterized protein YehS (DUF1456 family)
VSRNNENFKRLCAALNLRRRDVAEILNDKVSKSQIDGWMRSSDARKNATGNSNAVTVSRYRVMSDEHFDLFCSNLADWLQSRSQDKN